MNPISEKRRTLIPEYNKLIHRLRIMCGNQSELSGKNPNWESGYLVDPHHIDGRRGKLFLDPFNIIMLIRTEHDIEEGKIKGKKVGKEKLIAIVKKIRIRQGFTPND